MAELTLSNIKPQGADKVVVEAKYVKGGYVVTTTIDERDALKGANGENIVKGSLCYVTGTATTPVNKFYQYNGTTWVETAGLMSVADKTKLDGLSNALHFIGTTTAELTGDDAANPTITVGSESHKAEAGDVVLYGSKEFVWANDAWKELGDESSHALKTIRITAGDGLAGGGTLAGNVTISHADTNGNKHIPEDGEDEQILAWADTGTAKWVTPPKFELSGTTLRITLPND